MTSIVSRGPTSAGNLCNKRSRPDKRAGGFSVIPRIGKTDGGSMGGGQDVQKQFMIRIGKRG